MAELAHGYQMRYLDGIGRLACSCGAFAVSVNAGTMLRRKPALEHLRRLHEIHRKAAEMIDAFPQFPAHKDEV